MVKIALGGANTLTGYHIKITTEGNNMEKLSVLLCVLLLSGCLSSVPKKTWVNDGYIARGVQQQSAYQKDNSSCQYQADSRFGVSPPNGAYSSRDECTGRGHGGAIECGIRQSKEDHKWEQAKNNAVGHCLNKLGWELREVIE